MRLWSNPFGAALRTFKIAPGNLVEDSFKSATTNNTNKKARTRRAIHLSGGARAVRTRDHLIKSRPLTL
ncbi:MAG: hypothetical protein ACI9WC_001768 [Arenicella sp.]|jgi:hypothetical protein